MDVIGYLLGTRIELAETNNFLYHDDQGSARRERLERGRGKASHHELIEGKGEGAKGT